MDPAQFFAASRLVIVAGKGGVGKTTVSATLARAAARRGLSSLDHRGRGQVRPGLDVRRAGLLLRRGHPRRRRRPTGRAEVRARTLTPDEALVEYLEDSGMSRISKRLDDQRRPRHGVHRRPRASATSSCWARSSSSSGPASADLLVLDAPAAGHAISFLQSASGLADAVRLGPINAQARDVLELLADPERCQVVLVTLPEETPVNELVETAYQLEDRVGRQPRPGGGQRLLPASSPGLDVDPAAAAEAAGTSLRAGEADAARPPPPTFRRERMALQAEQVARLAEALPLPQLRLPYLFDAELGPAELDLLADALLAGVEALDGTVGAEAGVVSRRPRRRVDRTTWPLVARAPDHHLLRLRRRGQDHHRRGARHGGGAGPGGGPWWSPSTRPSGWPTPSASTASATPRSGSRAPGPASCGR